MSEVNGILKRLYKRMRMRSARLRYLAKKQKIAAHLVRSLTWEMAAQMIEAEWEALDSRESSTKRKINARENEQRIGC